MNILFESIKKFEKELSKFPQREKTQIILKLNQYSQLLNSDSREFYKHAYQPLKMNFVDGDESSLYVLQVSRDVRIIMTIDDDPLFDQILITLLHVVRHSNLEKVFKSIAESLYQRSLYSSDVGKF